MFYSQACSLVQQQCPVCAFWLGDGYPHVLQHLNFSQLREGVCKEFHNIRPRISSPRECSGVVCHLFPELFCTGVGSVVAVYFSYYYPFTGTSRVIRGSMNICSGIGFFDVSFIIKETIKLEVLSFEEC